MDGGAADASSETGMDGAAVAESSVEADAAGTDAGADGALTDAARRCDLAKPFGNIMPVPGLYQANPRSLDTFARLSPDELVVYFVSWWLGVEHVDVATRSSIAAPFGPRAPLAGVDTSGATSPTVTADGLTIYFGVSADGGVAAVFRGQRSTPANAFGGITALPLSLDSVYVSPDGTRLYGSQWAVDDAGQYSKQLVSVGLSPDGGPLTGPVTPIAGGVNSDQGQDAPVISADGLTLYFERVVVINGNPGWCTFVAYRGTTNDPFGTPSLVSELGCNGGPTWISPDGCTLYFAQYVINEPGPTQFVATRGQ